MDQSLATYLEGMGRSLEIPHTMFVLQSDVTVVVDTSFHSPEAITEAYPQDVWRSDDEHPLALLGVLGVDPDEVAMVVCTHLHYDHCGCNHLFPNATILVQRSELEYARGPTSTLMEREYFTESAGYTPPYDATRLSPVDGDLQIAAGLRLVTLPGHTPGSQGVLVKTDSGPVALAGDLIMVNENFVDGVPVGLHTDVDAWYTSLRKLRRLTDRVIPSHDLRIFPDDAPILEVSW